MRTVQRGSGSSEPVHPSGKLAPNRWETPPEIPKEEREAVRARLRGLIRGLEEQFSMERAAGVSAKRTEKRHKRPCAECSRYVEGCCGARPFPADHARRWPKQFKQLGGRWYARVSGDGCVDDFTAREGEERG